MAPGSACFFWEKAVTETRIDKMTVRVFLIVEGLLRALLMKRSIVREDCRGVEYGRGVVIVNEGE
jgi:hypothetical protein